MKGDFSRNTFKKENHYDGVRLQQGRVLLDADWNEYVDIQAHLQQTENKDIIGPCGAPEEGGGFKINLDANNALTISPGRIYVDGILCECEHKEGKITFYNDQPYYYPTTLQLEDNKKYLVYLDVWQRHITSLEDENIREVALGGPDTATRTQTVWQVKLLEVASTIRNTIHKCDFSKYDKWTTLTGRKEPRLAARLEETQKRSNLCTVSPKAGYTGLENRLYRVEIHNSSKFKINASKTVGIATIDKNIITIVLPAWDVSEIIKENQLVQICSKETDDKKLPGLIAKIVSCGGFILTLNRDISSMKEHHELRLAIIPAIFKWSRDNGSVVRAVRNIDETNNTITIENRGQDFLHAFEPGQWVEVIDEKRELHNLPGSLVRLKDGTSGINLVYDLDSVVGDTIDSFKDKPKVRRWDQVKEAVIPTSEEWIELEDGIQVKFKDDDSTYETGDYWLIPARTNMEKLEWPITEKGDPQFVERLGIKHHYCPLAILHHNRVWIPTDCRPLFPSLTNLPSLTETTTLSYVGGDGQEGVPGETLPALLEVRVNRGKNPVERAKVRFKIVKGNGEFPGSVSDIDLQTDSEGIAQCNWRFGQDRTNPSQQVEAALLDNEDKPISGQVIHFNAALRKNSGCCSIKVGAGGDFESLDEAINSLNINTFNELCICLLPGQEHGFINKWEWEITNNPIGLKIVGCENKTILHIGNNIHFKGLSSFTLKNIEIGFRSNDQNISLENCKDIILDSCYFNYVTEELVPSIEIKFDNKEISDCIHLQNSFFTNCKIVFSNFGEVWVDSCHFESRTNSAIIEIIGGDRLWLKNNVIKANQVGEKLSTAICILVDENRNSPANATLEDNEISGVVCLYHEKEDDNWQPGDIYELKNKLPCGNRSLQIRGNQLKGLRSGDIEFLESIFGNGGSQVLYNLISLTDNLIEGQINLIANHISLTSNRFLTTNDRLGWIIANSAIYVGNSSESEGRDIYDYSKSGKEVANLNININVQCNGNTMDSPCKKWPENNQ